MRSRGYVAHPLALVQLPFCAIALLPNRSLPRQGRSYRVLQRSTAPLYLPDQLLL